MNMINKFIQAPTDKIVPLQLIAELNDGGAQLVINECGIYFVGYTAESKIPDEATIKNRLTTARSRMKKKDKDITDEALAEALAALKDKYENEPEGSDDLPDIVTSFFNELGATPDETTIVESVGAYKHI